MRAIICVLGATFVALTSGQVVESRSSVKNPDGTYSHNTASRFSHSTFSQEGTGPDGSVVGRTVFMGTDGKVHGNEWQTKDGKTVEKKIDGADIPSGIGGRSTLGAGGFGAAGLGGAGGFGGAGFGNPGFGGAGFSNPGFGNQGFGAGYGGFPSGGKLPRRST